MEIFHCNIFIHPPQGDDPKKPFQQVFELKDGDVHAQTLDKRYASLASWVGFEKLQLTGLSKFAILGTSSM